VIRQTASGYEVAVQHSNRAKSADLIVEHGQIRIVVPKETAIPQIERIIAQKDRWIRQKLRLQSTIIEPKPKEFISGEAFPYLGKNYRLKVIDGSKDRVVLGSGRLEVCVADRQGSKGTDDRVRSLLVAWYREKALKRINEKVEKYSKRLGLKPQSVKVRDYKSRWGSCILPSTVSFNWRIVMAPHKIIDYVVVHELCHLKHHDHSERFWSTVDRTVRDSERSRAWLNKNSLFLRQL
jgi:predicted metal-dependent hydrolase